MDNLKNMYVSLSDNCDKEKHSQMIKHVLYNLKT